MKKRLLLIISVLFLTACAKEELQKEELQKPTSNKQEQKKFVCTTKPIASPFDITIVDKPIDFGKERIALTKAYIKTHYGKEVSNIEITPKIILLHWTANKSLEHSFAMMQAQRLNGGRKDIANASQLNVSAHFLVGRDGTIYRLMPENFMARHVIGLNYSAIGIENVGGEGNVKDDLTLAQRKANVALVRYLKAKYPTIKYLIGHHEYRQMENSPLWLEKDKGYRTRKADPGDAFVNYVYAQTKGLRLKRAPKGK